MPMNRLVTLANMLPIASAILMSQMLCLFGMDGGLAKMTTAMNGYLFAQIVTMLMATLLTTDLIIAQIVVQKWMEALKMAEYIDKEIALSLVQPDAPEDETGAVTIATAKKLVRSIIYRTPTADVGPVVHGKWIRKDNSLSWVCSRCGRGVNTNPEGIDLYCYHCGAKMDEKEDTQ